MTWGMIIALILIIMSIVALIFPFALFFIFRIISRAVFISWREIINNKGENKDGTSTENLDGAESETKSRGV